MLRLVAKREEGVRAAAHEPQARLAGFENFFDATVASIRPDAGTMHCRLAGCDQELEVPRARVETGAAVRIAVRAGDILLANQEPRGFWQVGTVFAQYGGYPWVPYVVSQLPARASYIGQRADLAEVIQAYAVRPDAAFLVLHATERLGIPVAFTAYPRVPPTLCLGHG